MKNFKNYPDLAASLVSDLCDARDNAFTGYIGRVRGNRFYEYQAVAKLTNDEQDELNQQSQVLIITEESFNNPAVVKLDEKDHGDGSFSLSSQNYQELLAQLIAQFDELEIKRID